ncbi:MAG: hypothetical protein UX39_C0016G0002 [Candidatus Magasanikbacteria bacterium GW2011_GWA2_46_17]|uniref:Uncharacterized protein n=1 Tax=Candidatus Magasanikbacteria bacterium GW2011_GWA2_46_17 TaxID=1619042 RepID=A0A0G1NZG7_9BACT|nr:MAG: hypothetical protein UX39_C0016G0002 [Candidatus Magasanikbacteria bacterium GW2011_GWA2_46_17]
MESQTKHTIQGRMKRQKLTQVSITLAQNTRQSHANLFAAKATKLLQLFCPGTEVSFSKEQKMMTVFGIRTHHGLDLTHGICAALAEGMKLTLTTVDFGPHP